MEFGGNFYLCGTGRQPLQKDKTQTDSYYLLTLAAISQELKARCAPPECCITIAAGLPLTSFGRDKEKFTPYLLRPPQPVVFRYEDTEYRVTIEDVRLFPQGYAAVLTEPDLVVDEPSLLAMDIGGWTVDLMRIDNGVPNADTCHSLELGMIRCMDTVREEVRRQTGLSVTDAQIEQLLAGGPCSLNETVRQIVREQGRSFTGKSPRKCGRRASQSVNSLSRSFMSITRRAADELRRQSAVLSFCVQSNRILCSRRLRWLRTVRIGVPCEQHPDGEQPPRVGRALHTLHGVHPPLPQTGH